MPEIDIPFAHGQSEGIDPKLLPSGVFSSVTNMRIRKDLRLVSRYGLKAQTGLSGSALASKETPRGALVLRTDGAAYLRDATGNYTSIDVGGHVPHCTTLGRVERIAALSRPDADADACDMGYVASWAGGGYGPTLVVVYVANQVLTTAFLRADGTLLIKDQTASSAANPRVIIDGQKAIVTYADVSGSNNIKVAVYTAPGVPSSTGTLAAAFAGTVQSYDACLGPTGTLGLTYHRTAATTLSLSTVVYATFTATERATIATGSASRTAVAFDGSSTYQCTWIDGTAFTVKRQKYTMAGLSGGTMTIDSNGAGLGFPTCAWIASLGKFLSTWTLYYGGSTFPTLMGMDQESGAYYAMNVVPMSRAATVGSSVYCWVATGAQAASPLGSAAKYMLLDVTSGCSPTFVGGHPNSGVGLFVASRGDAVACQDAARAGVTTVNNSKYDPRSSIVSVAALNANDPFPSVAYSIVALPYLGTTTYSAAVVSVARGAFGAGPGTSANGAGRTLLAGPRMHESDGSQVYEAGMGDGPDYVAVTTAAGSIAAGTYQWVVVWEWYDAQGVRHQSPPSLPVSVTAGSPFQATLTFTLPGPTDRGILPLVSTFSAAVYRTTLARNTIFQRITSAPFPAGPSSVFLTVTDNNPDSAINTNEILYTQGARGGDSGLLQNDEPSPCAYIWAGNNRFFIGGLEDPTEVRWSKLFFPGEAVTWTQNLGHRARVDAPVTAVCALDGAWYAFTRNSIWIITGDGPDDTGVGSFNDPVKLPSEIGCINGRSLLEVQEGVIFQARSDRLYLMPRGGGAPVWVGQAVRDTLASFPFISAAVMVPDENCAYFACTTADGSSGRLIVYDTRNKEWYVDSFYTRAITTLCVWQGKLLIDGFIQQTPGSYTDDDTGAKTTAITQSWITGDIRPFGSLGWGRLRDAYLLGEYRAPCKMTLEQSVDSGQSWGTAQEWDYFTGSSVGDAIKERYQLPIVRSDSHRIRCTITPTNSGGVTTPGEALALNSFLLVGFKADRGARLAATNSR